MANLSYATVGTGPIAGGLGWFDYGLIDMQPGDVLANQSATLLDGSTITFDLSYTIVNGGNATLFSEPENVYNLSPFGSAGYTGIVGDVVLKLSPGADGTYRVKFDNIVVKDPNGNNIANYNIYLADGEVTQLNNAESQVWTTNGGNWSILTILGNGPSPDLTGVGTQSATLTGIAGWFNAPVLSTLGPTSVSAELTTSGGQEAIVFGVSVTKLELEKVITSRISSTDQFQLNITGNPSDSATTSGNSTGLQSETAYVYAPTNGVFDINENMAAGSSSVLSQYNTTVSYVNLTPGGTVVPSGNTLPQLVTLAPADIIIATITNTPATAELTILKDTSRTAAIPGDTITYTLTISNPSSIDNTNVIVTDAIPTGTTFVGGSLKLDGSPIVGDISTGVNIGTVVAGKTVKVTFQVKIGDTVPVPNPIENTAQVESDEVKMIDSNTVETLVFDNSRGVEFI